MRAGPPEDKAQDMTSTPPKGSAMHHLTQDPRTSLQHVPEAEGEQRREPSLPTWRLNLMRVGYLVMGVGLVIKKWPELLAHDPWELKHGTVLTMLFAMSVLALLGLRHPVKMLPILLFEVGWKLTWLGLVALPLWLDDNLVGATREQLVAVLWVIIVIAVVPWRYTAQTFVIARGDRWR
jgi:hypothetical protein